MSDHRIYSDLVPNPGDFVGRVAYTFYKEEKINWIETQKATNPTAAPDISTFHNFAKSPSKLDGYRERAASEVNEFIDAVASQQIQQQTLIIRDDAIVRAVNKGWVRSIAENVVAGLIGSVITIGMTIMIWLYMQMQNPANRDQISAAATAELLKGISVPTPEKATASIPTSK